MNCQLFTNRKNRESNIFKVNMLVEPDSYKMASNTKKKKKHTQKQNMQFKFYLI